MLCHQMALLSHRLCPLLDSIGISFLLSFYSVRWGLFNANAELLLVLEASVLALNKGSSLQVCSFKAAIVHVLTSAKRVSNLTALTVTSCLVIISLG